MGRRQFGSVRKLPSGRYQARYTNAEGQQVTAPLSFTTKGDAGRWLAAAETDMRRGTFHDPTISQITFAEWAEEWLGFKHGQRPATLARDRAAIRTHFNPALGAMLVGRITPADIRRVVRAMQDSGLAAKSVRTYVGTLQAIFAAAVDTDVIPRSPVRTRTLGLRPVVRPVRPTLAPSEVNRLAQAVPPRHRALVLVAGLLGLRWGEAIGLRVRDVDLDARTIAVEQSVEEVAGRVQVVAQMKSRPRHPVARRRSVQSSRPGITNSASSSARAKALMSSARLRRRSMIVAVDALPTRSHTAFGGGPSRNASCRKSESFETMR